jgi:hypothetical protein
MRCVAALVAMLALSGCLAAGALEDVIEPPAGKPLVTGSVRVIEGDTEITWPPNYLAGTHFWLLVLAEGARRAVSYRLGAEAEFYWALAPGEYHVLGFVKRSFNRETSGRLWAVFTVPKDAGAVYIGDLTIRLDGGSVDAEVGDDLDSNFEALFKKYPDRRETPKWSLMKMVADQGSFIDVVEGCGGWGIDCDENFQGVTPLSPMTDGQPTGDVTSLAPALKWVPSKGDDSIRYDVVVFEEISFRYGFGAFSARLPGPAVAYLQNLWAAEFHVPGPLRPGARYNWSVRLRRGETVTAWSRYQKTGFQLPGFSGYTGPWFSFATPDGSPGG